MSKLLQINGITWKGSILGEKALLLEPQVDKGHLELIHQTTHLFEKSRLHGLIDMIPAYKNIALIYDRLVDLPDEVKKIQEAVIDSVPKPSHIKKYIVPICYELGIDWEVVEKFTSQKKEEIVQKHLAGDYKIAMIGFIPGFLYLDGLSENLSCPRKENPRTSVPAGSVGIGGNQTGIYSLESPGGWQIIGRTPLSFFNPEVNSPTKIKPGDKLSFERITEAEFEKLKTEPSS